MKHFFLLKNKLFYLFFFFLFLWNNNNVFSQQLQGKFANSNEDCICCREYIYFVNDTLVAFRINKAPIAFMDNYHFGVGGYIIENDRLTVCVEDYNIDSLTSEDVSDTITCRLSAITSGVAEYTFEFLSPTSIKLSGPIYKDFKKFKRKRIFITLIRPWQWDSLFKLSIFFEPRVRILHQCD